LGRVLREIERQVEQPTGELKKLLAIAHRIHAQQRHDKNKITTVRGKSEAIIVKLLFRIR
jgi:IS5 family transposase